MSTSSEESLVRLEGVSVSYGGHTVVHSVDLSVAGGEVVALIGPSGAGKSSLLRAINLLELPSSGRMRVAGHSIDLSLGRPSRRALTELRRDVGMVFQSFNLFPHLTALQNVSLAQVHRLKRSPAEARQRALRELEHVGLGGFADRKPANLSGGQQQRVAIARALAMDPAVMLFDEPTSALDPERGAEVLTTMRALAGEGMTMIVVTHEMQFAAEAGDRVIFMADGKVVEHGPARDVIYNPKTPRAQQFLSAVKNR